MGYHDSLIMRGLKNCLAEVALGQVLLKDDRFSGLFPVGVNEFNKSVSCLGNRIPFYLFEIHLLIVAYLIFFICNAIRSRFMMSILMKGLIISVLTMCHILCENIFS